MKREKKLTKRERKAQNPRPARAHEDASHIHCVACGRHIDATEFDGPMATATWVTCQHKSHFASCAACIDVTRERLAEHDRTGGPVHQASPWH